MMVIFTAQCEKKALSRSRRILDAFANRIGERTWQTIITAEGLKAVHKLLRQQATKNTAVACHWVRSHRLSQLQWIVGNSRKFNSSGHVPVNTTRTNLLQSQWENNWHYLPLIKALVAVAALLHDWGKANQVFQKKLTFSKISDPFRHEWVSVLLLCALVQKSGHFNTDAAWLQALQQDQNDFIKLEAELLSLVAAECKGLTKYYFDKHKRQTESLLLPLSSLPPLAQWVAWLIMSHHRLPTVTDQNQRARFEAAPAADVTQLFKYINDEWGYNHLYRDNVSHTIKFDKNKLLSHSSQWHQQIRKWAQRLEQQTHSAKEVQDSGAWRLVLHHAHWCLTLGDHYYSSCDKDKDWPSNIGLWANTDKERKPKQWLDEHLVNVCQHALRAAQSLSCLENNMHQTENRRLLKKSPRAYEWQDTAVQKIRQYRQQYPDAHHQGWFIVNMASTGQGKTIANAKIMQALSEDGRSLRYILALGLRTLTLQTGDVYRKQLGLTEADLAVLIGSQAIQELHDLDKESSKSPSGSESQFNGSESEEELLEGELNDEDFVPLPEAEFMQALFPPKKSNKNKSLLYKPVLVCTIDHIIGATETVKGGRYLLPCLRLLSSDLVLDEVDDFNPEDFRAISRLVHLAGMLGRKVMLSSATIPPDLAMGLFHAYQKGWRQHQAFKQIQQPITAMWIDEFKNNIDVYPVTSNETTAALANYQQQHQHFIHKRLAELTKQPSKQRAYIIPCEDLKTGKQDKTSLIKAYAERIKEHIIELHQHHHEIDPDTKKCYSFGVVRMANIDPCVAVAQYLMDENTPWPGDTAPRIMVYHSRQIMLLRHEQEHHLDQVLNRKPPRKPHENPMIRRHLDQTDAQNVIFILVASPVEEVGRDHDFDWGIIEPSSMRSIIQMCGRIRRHRNQEIQDPNIGILQYNFKGLQGADVAFSRPGYEKGFGSYHLETKDLTKLLDEDKLRTGVDASTRIHKNPELHPTRFLADLEHFYIQQLLTQSELTGPKGLHGWLDESWFLTGLPQKLHRFRHGSINTILYFVYKDSDHPWVVHERSPQGELNSQEQFYNIKPIPALSAVHHNRLWLSNDYQKVLRQKAKKDMAKVVNNRHNTDQTIENMMEKLSERYGELTLLQQTANENIKRKKYLYYSDYFGLFSELS
ncbi:type I-F CRISPR-associated helicase Cas3f [Neisseriaceae bacterium ESL0693]|nr:type I-F CRISPR-associated helicase Cas3f [Neisseriaceae bacterium ESL0693]